MNTPAYDRHGVTVHHGTCLDVMRTMPAASVDAVVCDPPYGLAEHKPATIVTALTAWLGGDRKHVPDGRGFLGSDWDRFVPPPAAWDECLRVLKPGGWLLAFAGARTQDLMGMSIRLAGFEIRDSIAWLYGSGFPKSLDVSKAIDKGARGDLVRAKLNHFAANRGIDGQWIEQHGIASAASFRDWTVGGHVPSDRNWRIVKSALEVTEEEEEAFERAVVDHRVDGIAGGTGRHAGTGSAYGFGREWAVTAPATDAARQWQGWGTGIKPAHEPLIVARKPLMGTVAANVLTHGTGALNIEACKVNPGALVRGGGNGEASHGGRFGGGAGTQGERPKAQAHMNGRWPPNVVLSHAPLVDAATGEVVGDACADGCVSGCPVAELDQQSGITESKAFVGRSSHGGASAGWGLHRRAEDMVRGHTDSGGASRFFPCFRWEAKAPAAERPKVHGKAHGTVKPLTLMRWIVRFVTPPGGLILDPFAGTGTTGHAARAEGMRAVLIEQDADHIPLIVSRLDGYRQPSASPADATARPEPVDLLDLLDGGAA
jgi:DNA modification methylase